MRPRAKRRISCAGQEVGKCTRIIVFISTTRAAILMRRRRECRGLRAGEDRTADRHGPSAASSAVGRALRNGAGSAAKSWSRVERIIARVEVGAEGPDTRFIVTNLKKRNARVLYEEVYCRRGQAENHIKSFKTQRIELGDAPHRTFRHRHAQTPHQPVRAGVEEQPKLIGRGLRA